MPSHDTSILLPVAPPFAAAEAMPAGLPLATAVDLQDHLLIASNDMARLQGLLAEACDALLHHFHGAHGELARLAAADDAAVALGGVRQHLAGAITAMQFQDMASQLVEHTCRRLRNCADRLAAEAMGDDDEDGAAVIETMPIRPNPVTQDEMDAGSIELF